MPKKRRDWRNWGTPKTRIFNKKTYKRKITTPLKRDATHEAMMLRKGGYLARIVKVKEGYVVYYRRKKK